MRTGPLQGTWRTLPLPGLPKMKTRHASSKTAPPKLPPPSKQYPPSAVHFGPKNQQDSCSFLQATGTVFPPFQHGSCISVVHGTPSHFVSPGCLTCMRVRLAKWLSGRPASERGVGGVTALSAVAPALRDGKAPTPLASCKLCKTRFFKRGFLHRKEGCTAQNGPQTSLNK